MDIQKADEYFASRLNAAAWADANDITRTTALSQAARELAQYKSKVNRSALSYAVCEQALWLLQDDKRGELQRAGVKAFSAGDISEQFDVSGRPLSIAPQAWAFIRGSGVKGGRIK